MTKTPEGYVKDEVKDVLKALGAYYFMPVQSGYGETTLDFLACIPQLITPGMVGMRLGLFWGIETKRAGVDATARQKFIAQRIQSAAGFTAVAHNGDELREQFK